MELKRLSQYTRLCRKLGISKLTIGDVTIELDLSFELPKPSKEQTAGATDASIPDSPSLTDEELLYWSSQGTNI